jgi:hypothetical protein
MVDDFKRFSRAYRTVLEMIQDRGYKITPEDAATLAERLTFVRFQSLSRSAFDMGLRHRRDDHSLLVFFLGDDSAGKRCITRSVR